MNILIKPVITEKAENLSEKRNQYTFIVDKTANKIQIKKEIEALYNVNVTDVNTVRMPGKVKVKGTRSGYQIGKKPSYKKAIVSLETGEHLDIYKNV
ncbi:MAG: 50S ribosomal protein L23 [Deltaproteobacteria bacterium]